MSITTRKEREWANRTRLILSEADQLLAAGGYLGLNLDELAEAIEYSKATIYNHFLNKEDLLLAVAVDHYERRADYFALAADYSGLSRECMCAVAVADEVLAEELPHGFEVMQLARTHSIWEKASEERREGFQSASMRCMDAMSRILLRARSQGDLSDASPEDIHILLGLISISKGSHLLGEGLPLFEGMKGVDLIGVRYDNYNRFLDGINWHPLSAEFDYNASRKKIRESLFARERGNLATARDA